MAVAAGTDAIGLNFYAASPRCISAAVGADIAGGLDVTRVGLFVDHGADEVEAVLKVCTLDMLQFNGSETERFCSSFGLPYMKTVHVKEGESVEAHVEGYADAWALLLDTYVPGVPGGTGRTFDWSLWPSASDRRLIIAGGLTPDNVAEAVSSTAPFGVDVAGGVEGPVKGRKDPEKVRAFVKIAKTGRAEDERRQ